MFKPSNMKVSKPINRVRIYKESWCDAVDVGMFASPVIWEVADNCDTNAVDRAFSVQMTSSFGHQYPRPQPQHIDAITGVWDIQAQLATGDAIIDQLYL